MAVNYSYLMAEGNTYLYFKMWIICTRITAQNSCQSQ